MLDWDEIDGAVSNAPEVHAAMLVNETPEGNIIRQDNVPCEIGEVAPHDGLALQVQSAGRAHQDESLAVFRFTRPITKDELTAIFDFMYDNMRRIVK